MDSIIILGLLLSLVCLELLKNNNTFNDNYYKLFVNILTKFSEIKSLEDLIDI